MNLAPLELLRAAKWERATFTTYALSLSFFEAVILDALIRSGSSEALILADVEGVRGCLGELGARRVGKDYDVEPIAVSSGVFHPKVTVLASGPECHVLIGSGNLTFSGWGGSLEMVEHLHPSFAATAIADLAGFFESLSSSSRTRHRSTAACQVVADQLRNAVDGKPQSPELRVLHSLGRSIREQLVPLAEELGGATQLLAAAPYWDDGSALVDLCASLKIDRVLVHVHEHGTVASPGTRSWPTSRRLKAQPVRIEYFGDAGGRRLHAKALEIVCRKGRIVVSGSANCSEAALGSNHNVEVCVARMQRKHGRSWAVVPSVAPRAPVTTTPPESDASRMGVLRATLEADELTGDILTPAITGDVTVFYLGSAGPEMLGTAVVDSSGAFRIPVPQLEEQSWRGGRLVVRVTDRNSRSAEGFVSLAGFGDIMRRAGIMGRRLLAVIVGTETPSDVAAIMEWFYQNPERLTGRLATMPHGEPASADTDFDAMVAVSTLGSVGVQGTSLHSATNSSDNRWTRFMSVVLAAFREPRGPLAGAETKQDEDEAEDLGDEGATENADEKRDPDCARALENFERLLAILASTDSPLRNLLVALDLTPFIFNRLRPPPTDATRLLRQLCDATARPDIPPERHPGVIAANMALAAASASPHSYRLARERLLGLGADLSGPAPSPPERQDYVSVLPQTAQWLDVWIGLQDARTYTEQVSAYVHALRTGVPSHDYPDLAEAAPREWPILAKAIGAPSSPGILFAENASTTCPRCDLALPPMEAQKLETIGIASATSCCGRIVIRDHGLSANQ